MGIHRLYFRANIQLTGIEFRFVCRKKKRKRKRIRVQNSDSSEDDDQDDNGNKKKGRKNIRKVLKNKDLEEDTKLAAREEQERKKRIEERQKKVNELKEKMSRLIDAYLYILILLFTVSISIPVQHNIRW